MNSQLRCALEGDAEPRHWTLVYPDTADFDAGRLSVLSPVGQPCWARVPARRSPIACRTAASSG